MKRLGRWIFNIAAAVSLLLFLAMTALWVRSYQFADVFQRNGPMVALLGAGRGRVGGSWIDIRAIVSGQHFSGPLWTYRRSPSIAFTYSSVTPRTHEINFGGLTYVAGWAGPRCPYHLLVLPIWLLTLMFSVVPVWWLVLWRRARAVRLQGHCAACGYNLTGNISGVCPECGRGVQEVAA
jgi:hypothetical protein